MSKQNRILEWKVMLSNTEWGRAESLGELLGDAAGEPMTQRRSWMAHHVTRLWATALMALLVFGIVSYSAGRSAQAGPAYAEDDIVSLANADSVLVSLPGDAVQAASTSRSRSESWAVTPADRQALIALKLRFRTEWDNIVLTDTTLLECRALLDHQARFRMEWNNIPLRNDGAHVYRAACSPQ